MKAKDFRNVLLFLCNHWSLETAIDIFGSVMGNHFYNKWLDYTGKDPHYANEQLLLAFDDKYLQIFIDYVQSYYLSNMNIK